MSQITAEVASTPWGTASLPHFLIEWSNDHLSRSDSIYPLILDTDQLRVSTVNVQPTFHLSSTSNSVLIVLGRPMVDHQMNLSSLHDWLTRDELSETRLSELNGEFLIILYDRKNLLLRIITDRFASIPFYYHQDRGHLRGSPYYNDLWLELGRSGTRELNESAFFEFLWFQRLYGTKTYDLQSRFLPSACCLSMGRTGVSFKKYWTPSFVKTRTPLADCALQLGDLLKSSIRRKLTDSSNRIGLFLSGGTDSRTVLAACPSPPTCFTFTVGENNECQVAREVAALKGARHIHVAIPPDPYSSNIDELVQLGGGMYAFDHSLFFGYRDIIRSQVDVAFHGHGIDYFFQGMYVPRNPVMLGKYQSQFHRLRRLAPDIVDDYMNNISHRLSDVSLLNFVKPNRRAELTENLRSSLGAIKTEGEAFCNDPYDFWEYFLIHALSRHYPYTNMLSMGTCVEQRIVTFDNNLFNFYLSLPVNYRLNGNIARMALALLSPELARVRTGNTNFPASFTPLERQMYWCWDTALYRTGLRKRRKLYAPASERTWPDRDELMRNHSQMHRLVRSLGRSEALSQLSFLDMDILDTQINHWLKQRSGGGKFLAFLLTLDRFLRQ